MLLSQFRTPNNLDVLETDKHTKGNLCYPVCIMSFTNVSNTNCPKFADIIFQNASKYIFTKW